MKSIIALIVALLIAGTGAYPQEMTAKEPLLDFVAFAEDEQLEVKEWTITIKETINSDQVQQIETKIASFLPDSRFKVEETIHANKKVWNNRRKNGRIIEYYSLIVPNDKKNQSEMVYVVKGKGTAFLTQKLYQNINVVKSRLFSKNVTIFSCLKTKTSGIMSNALLYQKFKEIFNIETLDQAKDNGWTSWSGHSNHWDESLPLLNEVMNVQFATRTLGGETNITIGTPIITAEY